MSLSEPIHDVWTLGRLTPHEVSSSKTQLGVKNLVCEREPSGSVSVDYEYIWVDTRWLIGCSRPEK
jgi:hypothetical protein